MGSWRNAHTDFGRVPALRAIYVRPVSSLTPAYMALIDPFRRWIVYPQILHKVREQWLRLYAEPLVAPGVKARESNRS